MFPMSAAALLGAALPLAVEVDFTPTPPPAVFPQRFRYSYVLASEAGVKEYWVKGANIRWHPDEWAAEFSRDNVPRSGAESWADGPVVTVTRFRGRPVTRFEWYSDAVRANVRWAIRPDRLAGPKANK